MNKPFTAEIIQLYQGDKLSTYQIASELAERGIATTPENVRNVLNRAKVPLRGVKEARNLRVSKFWTQEMDDGIRRLWPTGITGQRIVDELGLKVTPRAVYMRAGVLKLPRRARPGASDPANIRRNERRKAQKARTRSEINTISHATRQASAYADRTIISFLPESATLEMAWRNMLAKVRAERGASWTVLLGAER